jgi:hypothetical protein
LLESLSQKLAVLGPPRIVAEVPQDLPAVCELFESMGYRAEATLADFTLSEPLPPCAATGGVAAASLDDLLGCGALDPSASRSWERAVPTLQNRKDQLHGVAIATDTRVEAYALFRDLLANGLAPTNGPVLAHGGPGRREIVSLGGAEGRAEDRAKGAAEPGDGDATDSRILLEIAIRVVCQAGPLEVAVPKVSGEEISWTHLESLGFRKNRSYTRYAGIPDSNTG